MWATVGSTDLDWRSFLHNHELNAVVLGAEFGAQLQAMFAQDQAASDEIVLAQWQQRALSLRVKELFARSANTGCDATQCGLPNRPAVPALATTGATPQPRGAEMDRLAIGAELSLVRPAGHHAQYNGFDRGAEPSAGLSGVEGDVPLVDWNELLSAVKERLRRIAGEHAQAPSGRQVQGPEAHFPAAVLDCAAALDQLHATLMGELGRRRRLELEFFDARMALAHARAELASTRAEEQQARHLAAHDSLTLLPNRDSFLERLNRALGGREAQPPELAVLFLDLDGFKPINDTHGHDVGDALLRIVAARLSRAVRAEDAVGRLGGDEFACLLANVAGREQLGQLAGKLFDAVAAPLKIGQLELSVRPSIGIAVCPEDGMTANTLLKRADSAMYRAKRTQCGHAFFECGTDTRPSPAA